MYWHIRTSLAAAALLLIGSPSTLSLAQETQWRHASALVGEPRYAEGFAHYDYVNPAAPKGGTLNLSANGGFDNLNPIPEKGEIAVGIGLVYETLMTSSEDEISAEYGLLAEALSYPDDYSSVTYRLRENAKWHDGQPVTAQDVVWSFNALVANNPPRRFYYQHVTSAEALDERTVKFTFDEAGNKELPQIVGQLQVLPKHWWEAQDATGKQRDVTATSLEVPLGSGPYRISGVNPGSTVTFQRVDDYWGKDLGVNVGQHNFDTMNYTYFRDINVEFEAFKAGDIDFWSENQASRWATGYNFPAMTEGKIVREEIENPYRTRGILVGFIPNLRREKFQDVRVRKALNLAFDFETLNDTIFYNSYQRVSSVFHGTELAHSGKPEGKELGYLEGVRGAVPDGVFEGAYTNPVNGAQNLRNNLREAVALFRDAGYELREGRMVNAKTGEPFAIEVILNGPTIERVALPYAEDLRKIGIDMTVRSVEASQYVTRLRSRDFDMVYSGWAQSLSPGNEQMNYWGSQAADSEASENYGGISDPAVDTLVRNVVFAENREDLIAATKALDRVLMANQFVIPTYTATAARIAYWNIMSHPAELPQYAIGFPAVWWYDAEKVEAVR